MGTIVLLWCGKRNKKTPPDWVVFGADEGTCPPAGGAVARENSPPDCFLTRALQVPHQKQKKNSTRMGTVLLVRMKGLEPP